MARGRAQPISGSPTRTGDPLDTPMMRQYLELKKQHPDAVLLFRMGDFYEMFLEDAEQAAPLMDVALTARQNAVPMAGVPYHSVDTYVSRLIGAGRKVAIAEQEADPVNPKLMRRAVTRVITPGTLVEDALLDSTTHNYLLAVVPSGALIGLALADVSTNDFFSTTIESAAEERARPNGALPVDALASSAVALRDFISLHRPREILIATGEKQRLEAALPDLTAMITPLEDWKASPTEGGRRIEQAWQSNLRGLGYDEPASPALGAVSLVLHYMERTFPGRRLGLEPPVFRPAGRSVMLLDEQTIRNLDLVENSQEGGNRRTLFGVLNHCRTAPGKRFLREAITSPLTNIDNLEERRSRVRLLGENHRLREQVQSALERLHDLERTLGRAATGRGAPRDLAAVRETIAGVFDLARVLQEATAAHILLPLVALTEDVRGLESEVARQVVEEPPALLGKGPLLRDGVSTELDRARAASGNAVQWMLDFEREERTRTGLASLRVKYNRIVGYFIELSRAQSENVPADYNRKQTLVGAERFTCERLQAMEREVLEADEVIERIEREAFVALIEQCLTLRGALKAMMMGVAQLDFLCALGTVADRNGWTMPALVETGELLIESGRHPVVEAFLGPAEMFVANHVRMDASARSFAVITGPNMAGKSTYIRQVAIIQLLAQIGSYVPAKHAVLSIVDRVFTRIGASDNLTRGESTFFVEMLETARILNQATDRSLVIMDEVGRGTSTYDGLSIAWAIVEYLSGVEPPRPRVLFATHYHELTVLESRDGVFNLTMDVQENEGRVIFMHRIREGTADRSYGIHVAQLAGLPPEVTGRAEEKLAELEADYDRERARPPAPALRSRKRSGRSTETGGHSTEGEQPTLF